jgi:transposase
LWTQSGLWRAIHEVLTEQADREHVLIDSTSVRVHAHGVWALPVIPLGFILSGANVADIDQARPLVRDHLRPGCAVIMDKGYTTAMPSVLM